jgi:hypothetical protein
MPGNNHQNLDDWEPVTTYLIATGKRRRRCVEFKRNPCWDGVLKNKAEAREDDPETSKDARDSIPPGDIFEAKIYVDQILARPPATIVSVELREFIIQEIRAGRIDPKGLADHVRAESLRRRFPDMYPRRKKKKRNGDT